MKLSYLFFTPECRARTVLGIRGDLDQCCAELLKLRYDGIELMVRNPRELDVADIARTITRYGLKVPDVGGAPVYAEDRLSLTDADPTVRRSVQARLESMIELAARFGAQVHIGRFRGYLLEGAKEAESLAWLKEGLLKAAEYGQRLGVRVLVEPLCHLEANTCLTVLATAQFLRSLGHPNLGVLADTFHMNIEEVSLPASLMAAKDILGHVHFADSNRRHPGAGHINFREVLEALHLIGYEGFISFEIKQEPDPWTAARRSVRTIRALLDAL